MVPKQPLFSSQSSFFTINPQPSLLIIRLLCGLHLFVAAILASSTITTLSTTFTLSNLLLSTAPLQLPFLLFLSGFACTYASAYNHRHRKFSSSQFYVRRLSTILPTYIIVLILHAGLLSTSPNPLPRLLGSITTLSPYLPPQFAFPPHDAPFLAQNLIPCLVLCYLIFPIILDMLPRYDTTKRIHFAYVSVGLYALTIVQALWLKHLPHATQTSRSAMLFDVIAYVPFLAHVPTFLLGMVVALLYLSHHHHATSSISSSLTIRISRLIFAIAIFLFIIVLSFPISTVDSTTLRSAFNNWLICSALLPSFIAIVLASVSFSKPKLNYPHDQITNTSTEVLDHLSLLNLSRLSYMAYIWFPTLPRILSAALCHAPAADSSSSSHASRTLSLLCASRPPLPRVMGPTSLDNTSDSITDAAAIRSLSATFLTEPQIQPALFVLVLIFVVTGYYALGFSSFADRMERSFVNFVQRLDDGLYTNTRFHSLAKYLLLDDEPNEPRRENSNFERFLRVVIYFIAGVAYWCVTFRLALPITYYAATKPAQYSILCWLPNLVYECGRDASTSAANMGSSSVITNKSSSTAKMAFGIFVEICKYVSLLSFPAMVFNLVGHILFPRAIWKRFPTMKQMLSSLSKSNVEEAENGVVQSGHVSSFHEENDEQETRNHDNSIQSWKRSWFSPYKAPIEPLCFDFVIYIRYVTRGNSPNLVASNVERAVDILLQTGIPRHMWKVEVVTDNDLHLSEKVDDPSVVEIVVPSSYKPKNGTLFKARALNYAISHSAAQSRDWIIHLDEETRFDVDTMRAILYHCAKETQLTFVEKKQNWPCIGQGPILYGRTMVDSSIGGKNVGEGNWLTTLADSGRVSDDCGRYRVQYELGEVWNGMHGSFVVVCNLIEETITFDHGAEGSIAEDAFFAMLARAAGVHFAWIDAIMYEQSPFTLMDFIKQRSRWLVGGSLVVKSCRVPIEHRSLMSVMTTLWSLMPLTYFSLLIIILFGDPYDGKTNAYYFWLLPFLACASLWNYTFGFFVTFSLRKLGVIRFVTLFFIQMALTPVFGLLEVSAVAYSIWNYNNVSTGFHVVEKDPQISTVNDNEVERRNNKVTNSTDATTITEETALL